MRFDRLDLNLLVALDALIEDRSVSQTARRLFLSQPAVSGALNRLREFFNDEILIPSGRQMLLTPKAEELRGPVREALMLIRARITTPSAFDPATATRHFTIAASDNSFLVYLWRVLAHADRAAPGITFEIVTTGHASMDRFNRGEIDLLVSISKYLSDDHPREDLYEEEHAVICWSESMHRGGITEQSFLDAGHAVVVFGRDRHPAFTEEYFAATGTARSIQVKVPIFSALPNAVIGTNRLATMYRRQAEYFAQSLPITVHAPPMDLPFVMQQMQWHSHRSTDHGLSWLRDLFRDEAARLRASTAGL